MYYTYMHMYMWTLFVGMYIYISLVFDPTIILKQVEDIIINLLDARQVIHIPH